MCARILMDEGKIDGHEWHHFLAGGTPTSVTIRILLRNLIFDIM